MKIKKQQSTGQKIVYGLFCLGLVMVTVRSLYVWEHGYQAYQKLCAKHVLVERQINKMIQEIEVVESDITDWQPGTFTFECAVRQDLLMARPDEKVYYSSAIRN